MDGTNFNMPYKELKYNLFKIYNAVNFVGLIDLRFWYTRLKSWRKTDYYLSFCCIICLLVEMLL